MIDLVILLAISSHLHRRYSQSYADCSSNDYCHQYSLVDELLMLLTLHHFRFALMELDLQEGLTVESNF